MDYLIDKVIIIVLCLGLMILVGATTPVLIGMLVAISLAALFELPRIPARVRLALPLLYCLLALVFPGFTVFLPLAAGNLFRVRPLWLRGAWVVPLLLTFLLPERFESEILFLGATVCLCVLSCLLAWRGEQQEAQNAAARIKRDDLAEASRRLEIRNRDLLERQELELTLATLGERSRIAREIHDNVGHLLTRSILQVKALTVVHANDEQLTSELEQVGATLDTAFETVRTSVHNLYEEAAGLEAQLEILAQNSEGIAVTVEYRGGEVPPKVASSFLAMVREALSNTQRHSDATKVHITVVEFPGLYQLVVQDNGSTDPGTQRVTQGDGMGLVGMEERARAQGGTMRTSFDKGFKVFVSIPRERE